MVNAYAKFYSCKSQFREKTSSSSHWGISVSSTSQEYDNVTTPHLISIFRSIICQMVAYSTLKTRKNFELVVLKVVAVAYKRFQISWFNLKTFGILENWSLTRGGRNRRLHCIFVVDNKVKRDWLRDRTPCRASTPWNWEVSNLSLTLSLLCQSLVEEGKGERAWECWDRGHVGDFLRNFQRLT